MRVRWLLLQIGLCVFITNCGTSFRAADASYYGASMAYSITSAGWTTPIEITNDDEFALPIGLANSPIIGTTIQAIVTDTTVSVRTDGIACAVCHAGAGSARPEWAASSLTKAQVCNLVPSFLTANKPAVLKQVLKAWADGGCRD